MSTRHISGLALIDGTRLRLVNHDDTLPAITVNGKTLSYRDLHLGSIRITANKAFALDESDGQYYEIIHSNSDIEIKFDADAGQPAKVQTGQIIPAGDSLFKQQSPAPFAYIDTTGRLASANLWTSVWDANVMGYNDVDKGNSTYNHGLVPAGSDTHGNLFLRKDGQWGMPSAFTGSVADTLLSLQDTPSTYMNHLDDYLRVSFDDGGSIKFDSIDTSKVPEDSTNLYYTDGRVDTRMVSQLSNKSIQDISISGKLICNEVLADSDRKLKRNIEDLDYEWCLACVEDMQPKAYQFINQNEQRFGLIAQDLKDIIPTLVNQCQPTMSINYIELIPVLIGSIKQLKEELDMLRNQKNIVM